MFVLGRQDYHYRHEPCLYGWKPGAAHYFTNKRNLSTVLEYDRPLVNREHPTMKPIDLFADLIRNSSQRGDTVIDLFAGSGTTVMACEATGRTARVVELDPKYCDVIVRRFKAAYPDAEVYKIS